MDAPSDAIPLDAGCVEAARDDGGGGFVDAAATEDGGFEAPSEEDGFRDSGLVARLDSPTPVRVVLLLGGGLLSTRVRFDEFAFGASLSAGRFCGRELKEDSLGTPVDA